MKMFKCTTIKIKYNRQKEDTLLDQAYAKLNEARELFTAANEIEKLQNDLEEQIRYKRNKEYLYTNCNRIKKRFYHYRDEHNHPRITVCVLYDLKEKIACRGISMCSFVDPTNKENGRDRAEDRAIEAYITMDNSERILQEIPVENAEPIKLKVDKIIKSVKTFNDEIKEKFKSAFSVELTEFEKRLFQITE
jgi:hypothetical protein